MKDASGGDWKATLRSKGHTEFKGHGVLNVYGLTAHAIWSKEYIEMKNCTINIPKAVGDGINVNQYFLMTSGELNISGVGDDGIQVSLQTDDDGNVETDEENTGAFTMQGGTVNISTTAEGAKGVKSAGILTIDETSANSLLTITGSGGVLVETNDSTCSVCLKSDSIMNIVSGTLTLTHTGEGGRAMACDKEMNITGGTITARAEGDNFGEEGNNGGGRFWAPMYGPGGGGPGGGGPGGGEGPGGGGGPNDDNSNSKGAKAVKAKSAITISGGTLSAYSANHEGIESKSTITISGGEVYAEAGDDAINASSDFTITDGYVCAYSTGNDGMDANGNFYIKGGTVYAIGKSSPELAIDANSEDKKKLYLTGGTIVAIGGLESGSSLSQSCYKASSYSQGSWYALSNSGTLALAFKVPTSSNMGTPMVVSTSGTTTLTKSPTLSGGTSLFGGMALIDATATGGTTVSLTSYK